MADVDYIAQIELLDDGGDIGRVVIHVVAVADRTRTPVPATVMSDDAVALAEEVEHLRIPVVGAQRPAVMEEDRLRSLRAPILVEDMDAVRGRNACHVIGLWRGVWE